MIIRMLGELVDAEAMWTKLRSSSRARRAVASTGKYSGRQPAMTALAAAFSEVMTRRRISREISSSSPVIPAYSSISRTL